MGRLLDSIAAPGSKKETVGAGYRDVRFVNLEVIVNARKEVT